MVNAMDIFKDRSVNNAVLAKMRCKARDICNGRKHFCMYRENGNCSKCPDAKWDGRMTMCCYLSYYSDMPELKSDSLPELMLKLSVYG